MAVGAACSVTPATGPLSSSGTDSVGSSSPSSVLATTDGSASVTTVPSITDSPTPTPASTPDPASTPNTALDVQLPRGVTARPADPADTTWTPAEALARMRAMPDIVYSMEDPTIRFLEVEHNDGTWEPSWIFVAEVAPAPPFGPAPFTAQPRPSNVVVFGYVITDAQVTEVWLQGSDGFGGTGSPAPTLPPD